MIIFTYPTDQKKGGKSDKDPWKHIKERRKKKEGAHQREETGARFTVTPNTKKWSIVILFSKP